MTDTHRPITSKARGVCKYFTTERGCFAGDSCKFLHSTDPALDASGSRPPNLTPYDKAKRCKYYSQGYCKRGDKCWFIHEIGTTTDDDDSCSICFDKPSVYGLLGGCSHIFCIDCIRKWRDRTGKNLDTDGSNIKKCPMCRAHCRYIIPSSRFVKDGSDKEKIVQNYKDSMARVPCKHFVATKAKNPSKPLCPYGKDCFYQHHNDDGTPYIFSYGSDVAMRNWAANSRNGRRFAFLSQRLFSPAEDEEMAGAIAMGVFDRVLTRVMGSSLGGRGEDTARHEEGTQTRRLPDYSQTMMELMNRFRNYTETTNLGDGGDPRVIFPDIFVPLNSDLEGDGEGVDHGWGWNELVAEAARNADPGVLERLESLTDNILGSMRFVRGRDTELLASPLEPIPIHPIREETPPPPLEPIHNTIAQEEEDDDLPALQSVSNSSDSEMTFEEDEQEARHPPAASTTEHPPFQLESVLNWLGEQEGEQMRREEDLRPNAGISSRFSTVVDRDARRNSEEENTENPRPSAFTASPGPSAPVATTPLHEVITSSHESSTSELGTEFDVPAHLSHIREPPFVTDGRGRVVWSNKDPAETANSLESPGNTVQEPQQDAQTTPSGVSRIFGWMSGLF